MKRLFQTLACLMIASSVQFAFADGCYDENVKDELTKMNGYSQDQLLRIRQLSDSCSNSRSTEKRTVLAGDGVERSGGGSDSGNSRGGGDGH